MPKLVASHAQQQRGQVLDSIASGAPTMTTTSRWGHATVPAAAPPAAEPTEAERARAWAAYYADQQRQQAWAAYYAQQQQAQAYAGWQ